jgi:molecular chaperone DnaK
MDRVIGIDLGTTNSVVAVVEGGRPKVIPNREGNLVTPSVVAFSRTGELLVGQTAKRQATTNPERTIFSIKRFMGRRFDEVENLAVAMPFPVVPTEEGEAAVQIGTRLLTPPEISAIILDRLRQSAEDYLGGSVTDAVITVPAYFNDRQRQATREAGELAGLNIRRIINEPTAAALAYSLDNHRSETIAVFDFGGGTFDISILQIGDGVVEVKATNGDTWLGGDNIDDRLLGCLIEEFAKTHGIELYEDAMAVQRLKEAAEAAKKELSTLQETDVNVPFLCSDASGPKHLESHLTRPRFESLIDDILQRLVDPCRQAMADAGLSVAQLGEVLLVGGSTRVPRVQQMVRQMFQREPRKNLNPDEVVAMGAAVQGALLSGDLKGVLLLDVTPLSLGIETQGGVFAPLIDRNTTIPARATRTFSTVTDNQEAVEIRVYQGESHFCRDNQRLGVFELSGIQPAPRAVPQIEVTFDIDENGILKVSATDRVTQAEKHATIVTRRHDFRPQTQAV